MLERTFGIKEENVTYKDRIGAYAIIIEEGLVATVKTIKSNFLIGGGIEENESFEECIIRECIEETGYDIEVKDFICKADTYLYVDNIGYFHPVGYFYLAKLKNIIEEPSETDHVFEWIKLEDIDKKMYLEHQIWAVKQALNK